MWHKDNVLGNNVRTYVGIEYLYFQELSQEELEKVKKDLVDHFSTEESAACGVKSLYFELLTKR